MIKDSFGGGAGGVVAAIEEEEEREEELDLSAALSSCFSSMF